MSKVPTEKQLESTFEVLAWLERQLLDHAVDGFGATREVRHLIKQEVDRCLTE